MDTKIYIGHVRFFLNGCDWSGFCKDISSANVPADTAMEGLGVGDIIIDMEEGGYLKYIAVKKEREAKESISAAEVKEMTPLVDALQKNSGSAVTQTEKELLDILKVATGRFSLKRENKIRMGEIQRGIFEWFIKENLFLY